MKFSAATALAALLVRVEAAAVPVSSTYEEAASFVVTSHPFADVVGEKELPSLRSRQASKVPLRILPLGASIVFGIGSSNGNGFRKPLRDALRYEGWSVNMVGTKSNGDMLDSDNEGTPGALIGETLANFQKSAGFKPNVIVINVGTNDANGNVDVTNAGNRMRNLLTSIWDSPDMKDACVMLSTLLPSGLDAGRVNRIPINNQYRNLVSTLQGSRCIYLAEMDPESGPATNWVDMTDDGVHPNDTGHKKMAYIFWKAITKAASDGKIKQPSAISTAPVGGCDKKYGDGVYAGALTQQGSGLDDGIYYHESQGISNPLLEITSDVDRGQFFFARLYGRKYDDLLEWWEPSAGKSSYGVWKNFGNGNYRKIADMGPSLDCKPQGVHWIDMNADGYDDIVCINAEGTAYLAINQRDGTDSRPPTFKKVGSTGWIMDPVGYKQDRVRMADIDGDGRGDYCIIDDGGNVHCWRNGWVNDKPEYWQSLGKRFNAKGKGDIRGVRFEDINGDGRDDWMWVSDVGAVETWTNARSCASGQLGDGLNVAWRQAFYKGASSGNTHNGMGEFAKGDEKYLRDRIHFARVYGEAQDFGLLGRQDYVFMQHEALSNGKHKYQMRVWKNVGFGGTKLKADGNKYCNMLGHKDGRMDYVWTLMRGEMTMYPGRDGISSIREGESWWGPSAVIWNPEKLIGKPLNRADLHLADWDGDGVCDIVWVNPDNQNRPSVWLNKYPQTKNWNAAGTWEYYADPGTARNAQVQCTETRGIGIHDVAVRMADITGNGRADYLCLRPDGHVTAFLHESDNSWTNVGQVKFADGMDRANLRWADVNGDGKEDMIWVDKFNGDGKVFYNEGRGDPGDEGGSAFHWRKVDKAVYDGNHAGTCMYYPDLDGNGRADMHSIIGTFDNRAETWLNPSCNLSDHTGDDPGCCSNPNLPVQPGGDNGGGGGGGGGGDSCTSGHGSGDWDNLCKWMCKYGFCPKPCTCDSYGSYEQPPPQITADGVQAKGKGSEFAEACAFACSRGYCPSEACRSSIGAIFLPSTPDRPISDIDGFWKTGCREWTHAPQLGCNLKTFPNGGGFDPLLTKQDCSGSNAKDPNKCIWPWREFCNPDECDYMNSVRNSVTERWNHVASSEALDWTASWYGTTKDAGLIPDELQHMAAAIAYYYGGFGSKNGNPCDFKLSDRLHCDILGDQSCKTIECGTTMYPAIDAVLTAMFNFHNTYNKFYDSLASTGLTLHTSAEDLVKDFVRKEDKDAVEILKEALGYMDIVFAVAGAGVWGKLLSSGAFEGFKKLVEGPQKIQGYLNDAMSSFETVAGPPTTQAEKAAANVDKIKEIAEIFVEGMRNSIDAYVKWIFSGDVFGANELKKAFANGMFLEDPGGKLSTNDFVNMASNTMLAKMAQVAWTLGNEQVLAVVWMDETDLDNFVTRVGGNCQADLCDKFFSKDHAKATRYPGNFVGVNKKTYSLWMVNANKPKRDCSKVICETKGAYFEPLQGQDKIAKSGNKWGFTWQEMAESAMNGYIINNFRNGYGLAKASKLNLDVKDEANFFALQQGVSAPGFVQAPVCFGGLAYENLIRAAGSNLADFDCYPCCEITWEVKSDAYCHNKDQWCR